MILQACDPYIEVSLKDPDDISDPYSGNVLILKLLHFLTFYQRIRIPYPSSSSHEPFEL
ncbi:hypothetical protein HanIR_Chr13g0627451 [Helianthus annuus]|nr:hypothetical protein HanIR_Chr13g0627451 [Helianthus annuus]